MGGEVPPAAAAAGVLAGRGAAGHAAGVRAAVSLRAPRHHLYPAECRQLRRGLHATAAADPEPVLGSGQGHCGAEPGPAEDRRHQDQEQRGGGDLGQAGGGECEKHHG